MSDVTSQSLNEILDDIKSKKISSLEVTKSYIKNIESAKKLNAFVTTTFDQALENAKKFDRKPNFEKILPGVPLAVKDLFCTENIKTTAGSNILNNFVPSYESTVTKNLWDNGAFLLGKLN
jgi:aspartyl-tRNA(Asn)/glutamyl-tRNA(Gln) amidotransferase subunit A